MNKQSKQMLQYLDGMSELTVPMLQRDLNLSYDEARAKMSELENDGFVSFKGGLVYCVDNKRVSSAIEEENEDMVSYLERRKSELLERLKRIEMNNFDEDADDDSGFFDDEDEDFDLSDEDEDKDQEYDNDDDNELAKLFRTIVPDQDDAYDDEVVEENMSVFLSHDLMPYRPKQVYYDIIREVYDDAQEVPICVMSKEEVLLFKEKLGDGFEFDEKKTEKAGWKKAFFTSSLYLPDGVLYAPVLTSNENGDYFLQHKLIDPEDEGKLCVRQEFYMLLKRHDMIFGDCMLAKQFSNVSDAVIIAIEFYGALSEAKMLLDVI